VWRGTWINRIITFDSFDNSGQALAIARTLGKSQSDQLAITALNYGSRSLKLSAGQPLIIEEPAVVYSTRVAELAQKQATENH
jgi:hypothetical protein